MQTIHGQESPAHRLRSVIVYLETIMEMYESQKNQLLLAQQLKSAIGLLQEIRRELLIQELTTVLHNEDLPETARKEKIATIFHLLT
jgi:DNA-binding FrmR family transcriptional regulator